MATCHNVVGSHYCTCWSGYIGDGFTCTGITPSAAYYAPLNLFIQHLGPQCENNEKLASLKRKIGGKYALLTIAALALATETPEPLVIILILLSVNVTIFPCPQLSQLSPAQLPSSIQTKGRYSAASSPL